MPTQQQQSTALIILGMIGAEFNNEYKGNAHSKNAHPPEVMDRATAALTAKTLQAVLLEKPSSSSPIHSNLRCSAAELVGRGFPLWEKYVDIQQVGVVQMYGVVIFIWSKCSFFVCFRALIRKLKRKIDSTLTILSCTNI